MVETTGPADRCRGAVLGMFVGASLGALGGRPTFHDAAARCLLDVLGASGPDAGAYRRALDTMAPVDGVDAEGRENQDTVVAAHLGPLVVGLAGDPRLMIAVDDVTRIVADDDQAVAYACAHARLLEHLLAGRPLDAALDDLLVTVDRRTRLGSELSRVIDIARAASSSTEAPWATRHERSFARAFHLAIAQDWQAIAAPEGGCGADHAAAMLAGTWLGAGTGGGGLPPSWRAALTEPAAIEADLERLLGRSAPRRSGALS